MAKIILEIRPSVVRKIRDVLQRGGYESLEEFMWVSIANQLHLESSEMTEINLRHSTFDIPSTDSSVDDPLAILRASSEGTDLELLEVNPTQEPLWGMYYRFLPLKVAVRCIANSKRGSLDEILAIIGNAGLAVGDGIRDYEKRMAIKRGYGNSQGFPGKRKDVEASLGRFLNLYVGTTLKRSGRVSGMLHEMGFGSIKDGQVLLLSNEGSNFSSLVNPVIDESAFDSPLSDGERMFLLDHIRDKMPGEYDFMRAYYDTLANGPKSPSEIAAPMHSFLQQKIHGHSLTESVMATMTSGVQSRMIELNLVEFERVGTSSKYEITEFGREIFEGE